jgi:hypothetical protein
MSREGDRSNREANVVSLSVRGNVLTLRGDTNAPTKLSVLFPSSIGEVRWIGSLDGPPARHLSEETSCE